MALLPSIPRMPSKLVLSSTASKNTVLLVCAVTPLVQDPGHALCTYAAL